jgi:hypothetical protein
MKSLQKTNFKRLNTNANSICIIMMASPMGVGGIIYIKLTILVNHQGNLG